MVDPSKPLTNLCKECQPHSDCCKGAQLPAEHLYHALPHDIAVITASQVDWHSSKSPILDGLRDSGCTSKDFQEVQSGQTDGSLQ